MVKSFLIAIYMQDSLSLGVIRLSVQIRALGAFFLFRINGLKRCKIPSPVISMLVSALHFSVDTRNLVPILVKGGPASNID
jgi:hypothetical protein